MSCQEPRSQIFLEKISIGHRAYGSLQGRQHVSDCWRTLPLQTTSVGDEGRCQVRGGMAAMGNLFQHHNFGAHMGKEVLFLS